MNRDGPSDALAEALRTLETNLETPVVPGELTTWIRNVKESCDAVGCRLREAIEHSHEERFQQIVAQDPALMPRVQQLRIEDQELLGDAKTIAHAIANLEKQNGDRVANQAKSDERIAEIVELGIAFVVRTRTQETALSTWHMEAFQRDRGVAD